MSAYTHEEVSNTLRLAEGGPVGVELVVEGEGTAGAAIAVPRWRGGYHDEQVRLERALMDGFAAGFDAGATELTLGTAGIEEAVFPTEPLVLIVLGTARRFLKDKPGAGLTLTLVPGATAVARYRHLFDEFTRTMVGTR